MLRRRFVTPVHHPEEYYTSPEKALSCTDQTRENEWLFCGALLAQAIIILTPEM